MTNAKFGFQNWVASGALADSSHASTKQTAFAMKGPSLFPGWCSGTGVVSANFTLDAGASVAWDVVGLFGTNFDPGAGTTLQISLGTTLGASDVYASGSIAANVVAGYRQSITVLPQTYTARYLKVAITDSGNSDGFLTVGMAYAGPLWTPSRNFSYGQANGWQDDTTFQTSKGGQQYPIIQQPYRHQTFKLENLNTTELWAQAAEIDRLAGVTGNILFIPDPAGSHINQEALFGRIVKSEQPVRSFYGLYSKSYDMRERL